MRVPIASATAFAIAGATGVRDGSPMPFAPNGPLPLGDSKIMLSTLIGTSIAVGMRYSLKEGVTSMPSWYMRFSVSA